MTCSRTLAIAACALLSLATACGSDDDSPRQERTPEPELPAERSTTLVDLEDVKTNPTAYEWFDFRPNVKKLILAGAAETEHIAILWYTVEDGSVGLHYHAATESVYVIDGTQTDAKGAYPTGTVYFNPPGSGHAITDSSGFFVLAYAAPPDFMSTDLIQEYTPIRIDTEDPELTGVYAFEEAAADVQVFTVPLDVQVFTVPLDSAGGLAATFVETTSSETYEYEGNYLLVLEGSCEIDGETGGENLLVVNKAIEPRTFELSASQDSSCLALGVSF